MKSGCSLMKKNFAQGKDLEQRDECAREEAKGAAEAEEQNASQISPEPGEAEFSGGDEPATTNPTKTPEVSALEDEKKALLDRLARLQADFDNFRRRTNLEREELKDWVEADVLGKFLPIMDNFERALSTGQNEGESFLKGVEMIYRQFQSTLEKAGVTVMEAEGQPFDPNLHHAVIKEAAPEGVQEDTVIAVMQRGYYYKDRVIRPAMVKVAE